MGRSAPEDFREEVLPPRRTILLRASQDRRRVLPHYSTWYSASGPVRKSLTEPSELARGEHARTVVDVDYTFLLRKFDRRPANCARATDDTQTDDPAMLREIAGRGGETPSSARALSAARWAT